MLWKLLLLLLFAFAFGALFFLGNKAAESLSPPTDTGLSAGQRDFLRYLAKQRPALGVTVESDGYFAVHFSDTEELLLRRGLVDELLKLADSSDERQEVFRALATHLDDLRRSQAEALDPDTLRGRLRPMLVDPTAAAQMAETTKPVLRDLPELGLKIGYVIDHPDWVSYVDVDDLDKLKLDRDALHAQAIENLRNDSPPDIARKVLGEKELVRITYLDSYDATRILLLPDQLRDGEAVGACIPDRETLLVFPVPETDDWSRLNDLCAINLSDRLLVSRPIRVTNRGFELR